MSRVLLCGLVVLLGVSLTGCGSDKSTSIPSKFAPAPKEGPSGAGAKTPNASAPPLKP
jgi:hypothetical protein